MNYTKYIAVALVAVALSGCGIYRFVFEDGHTHSHPTQPHKR